jgi:hypothetical protein
MRSNGLVEWQIQQLLAVTVIERKRSKTIQINSTWEKLLESQLQLQLSQL